VRESETVSTAILSGWKGSDVSMPAMVAPEQRE
jgi:hypothetical protein